MRAWDSRGHAFRHEYDALRRPLRHFVRGHDAQSPTTELLFGRIHYGEGEAGDLQNNLRTRAVRVHDTAGVTTSEAYDYKGNLLRSRRQLAAEYRSHPDWSGAPALEPGQFASSTRYDALNRPVAVTTPDGSVTRADYNDANLLERQSVNLRGAPEATIFVAGIEYNARGQRTRIAYGNGAHASCRLRRAHIPPDPAQHASRYRCPAGAFLHLRRRWQCHRPARCRAADHLL